MNLARKGPGMSRSGNKYALHICVNKYQIKINLIAANVHEFRK
jgi:hypothetical protein